MGHKPGCTATEAGLRLEISDKGCRGIVLSVCSENKGTDQLRGYCRADLGLCFHIYAKIADFLTMSLLLIHDNF